VSAYGVDMQASIGMRCILVKSRAELESNA
jgi:hypothetical protein